MRSTSSTLWAIDERQQTEWGGIWSDELQSALFLILVPDGAWITWQLTLRLEAFQRIPILATVHGNQLYASLQSAFEAKLLDRHDTPDGAPAYMTVRIGDSVMTPRRRSANSQRFM